MNRYCFYTSSVLALVLSANIASAAPDTAAARKNEPNAGVISSTQRGFRSTVVDTAWSGNGGAETGNPIAGSVSRLSPREWKMVLANNSKDPYSVDIAVQQIDARGSVTKTDHFSYTLKAGQSVERSVSAGLNAVDAKLNLGRWKNLAPPEKPAADAGKDAAKPGTAEGAPVAAKK